MSEQDTAALFDAIEGEIVPRLMLAHQDPGPYPSESRNGSEISFGGMPGQPHPLANRPPCSGSHLSDADHARFLDILMGGSDDALSDEFRGLLDRGVSRSTLFVELLGGAAAKLGELWERDECDFTDVTIGLCRLHGILRQEGSLYGDAAFGPEAKGKTRSVLLTTASEEQHIFGVVLVAEFFRRAGWQVWSEPGASKAHLCGLLGSRDFDIIGVSAAMSTPVEDVATDVESYRKASRNRSALVLVGGSLFSDDPTRVDAVDADGLSTDARHAPELAEGLLRSVGKSS